jgi:ATP-dependent DNA helicase Q1
VESLLIHLLLSKHLKEDFQTTAYSVNVYIIPGSQALRLSRLSRANVEGGQCPTIEHTFLKKTGKRKSLSQSKTGGKGSKQTALDTAQADDDDGSVNQQTPPQIAGTARVNSQHGSRAARKTTKRKWITRSDEEDGGVPDSDDDIAHLGVEDDVEEGSRVEVFAADGHTPSNAQDGWSYSFTKAHSRGDGLPNKRRRLAQPDVIELSD